ncbi:hypothetical protein K7472_24865 [Streptomyces sp. PTM05]|uniref:DUF2637 domain-containing protein n=1 Tax=Streptantibioticus parmotrematis TaxID=2873249 RepID=A0ABS7R1Z7_9ACTN|nr:hypothetical protein [Streptantibioticus parmotrematis]
MSAGTWLIVAGAMLYSVLTVTPLAAGHTPTAWRWTAPILPIVVDAAVVIVVCLDATLARLGGRGGRWPVVLRWMTGVMTLALNIGNSALSGDGVGVAVHSVAPLLLIVTSETSLAYRHAIARALARLNAEEAERRTREQRERDARAERLRAERERERATREQREREKREHAERVERERREWEAAGLREQREHEALLAREARDAEATREREQAERAERERERERAERQRQEQLAAERAERERREREARKRQRTAQAPGKPAVNAPVSPGGGAGVNTTAAPVNTSVNTVVGKPGKLDERDALAVIDTGIQLGASVRHLARETGWSVGWVAARIKEAGGEVREDTPDGEAA